MLIEREHQAEQPVDDRDAYLRAALVTLRKLGLSADRWLDGLDALGEEEPDPLWRRALADQLLARQPVGYEMLLELIGFGLTDGPALPTSPSPSSSSRWPVGLPKMPDGSAEGPATQATRRSATRSCPSWR